VLTPLHSLAPDNLLEWDDITAGGPLAVTSSSQTQDLLGTERPWRRHSACMAFNASNALTADVFWAAVGGEEQHLGTIDLLFSGLMPA
jgi:hypothetical protein